MMEAEAHFEPTRPDSGRKRMQGLSPRPKVPTWNEQTFFVTRPLPEVKFFIGQTIENTRGESLKILEHLGEGGMGNVYKMKEKRSGREVAVKFLNSYSRGTQALVERFKREIRVLGRMQNPFIVSAHDVIEVQVGQEKMVGLVMEYVEGLSLEDELDEQGPIEPQRAVTIGAELAVALESLREAGIVHRDLKPANIFLQKTAIPEDPHKRPRDSEREEFVRVGDFGIVGFVFQDEIRDEMRDERFEGLRTSGSMTKVDKLVGSPLFMSPEAAMHKPIDHRSDLYLLGLVLYTMLTGDAPFKGNSTQEIMIKQVKDEAQALKYKSVYDVPEWMDAIVRKLIEKNPKDRYQTAGEVFRAFKEGVRADYPELLNQMPFNWDF